MKKGTGKYTPALILYLLMTGTAIHAETQTETSAMPRGTEEGTELCGHPCQPQHQDRQRTPPFTP